MENILQEPAVAYNRRYTLEEYLSMEWENGMRYEYWEGELVAMAFETKTHNLIIFNISNIFRERIKRWLQ